MEFVGWVACRTRDGPPGGGGGGESMTSLREEDQKLGPVCLFLVCFVFSSSPPSILFLFFCTVTNGLLGCWVVVAPFTRR